ncbi:MAG: DUF58 domain-containing protein [Vulcanimicrobiaceae bacterium]
MKALWLRAWVGPRLLWALGMNAAFFCAAGPLPVLLLPAFAALVLLTAFTVADLLLGPPGGLVAVERLAAGHFALRVPVGLSYRVTNHSPHGISAGLIDTPVPALRFEEDELRFGVPALTSVEPQRRVLPVMRGEIELGAAYLWYENRLGLIRRRRKIPLAQKARVYPDLSAVERYGTLHVRNRLIDAGLRKMRLRGAGSEFESLREWSSGDAFRAVDWNATARRGKLMVAQREVERSQNIMLLLDAGRLMTPRIDAQRKFDYAITSALSLATIAGLANDRIGFAAFAGDLLFIAPPRSGRTALKQNADRLYSLEPRFEEADYGRAFAYVRSHVHKRSLIVLFTDMFDPVASTMALGEIRLLARRHLVVCVFMNDEAIESALRSKPSTPLAVYRAGVAATLQDERRAAKSALGTLGVRVVDVPAAKLSVALIDAYLEIKARALL